MYKTLTELKHENAVGHLMRIERKLDNLEDVSKINDVIRILRQPHDTSQWIERELIDSDGRLVVVHECLNCHDAFSLNIQYCPSCGALMVNDLLEDKTK